MIRGVAMLLLLCGTAASAAADGDAHRHSGYLFEIRMTRDWNTHLVYRAFLPDPADPSTLLVERGGDYMGRDGRIDLDDAACPGLRRAVEALAEMPLPAIDIGLGQDTADEPTDSVRIMYTFNGFVRHANGGEGEVSFHAGDAPGGRGSPQLDWIKGLIGTFEACRPGERLAR